ncbi:NUMOD3 domain-containing DNA-binding protein, partial [Candidatus Dojkabacteria bacterium]|nr:NUMOD3 domain-containing DNA-binding protein [Candidatus Dojkabacteria bacterium]
MPSGIYKRQPQMKEKCRLNKLGNKNPMWGKHLSEEHRKKISIANIGIKNPHSLESGLKIGN